MSIFSVFSRGGSGSPDQQKEGEQKQAPQESQQQQQQYGSMSPNSSTTLLSDSQVESNSKSYYQVAPTTSTSRPSNQSATSLALDQMQGGVSEFLSQVDFSSPQLNPIASAGGIEYLNLEDGPIYASGVMPSRGWSDDLCYGTGTLYIMGLASGGAWGFMEGMKSQHGRNFKLRLNSVLNSMTRRGPFVGNSLGVLAMFYNSINSVIGAYRGTRDQLNSLGAAGISGMLFKIGSGPRASLISSILCTSVVGAYHVSVSAYANYKQKKVADISLTSPSERKLADMPTNTM
ncbi:Mitochondrial import inner membrane translocase subunit tim23 [Coemansia erecta]|nr:Mitochondrial import inner membrane translocase subunit tim23 [Coemansia erecta]KAJ2887868.1 Mitochondrial import inner membrane translocase subunit tim23 [Coemansia asiatica]